MIRTFQYAPLRNVADWLALGWLPHSALRGTHHGDWSVLVEWLCSCPNVRPK